MPPEDNVVSPLIEAEKPNENKGLLTLIYESLKDTWPDIKLNDNQLFIDRTEKILIAKEESDFYLVNRVAYKREANIFEVYQNPKSLILDKKVDLKEVLRMVIVNPGKYWLASITHIRKFLSSDFEIELIEVGNFNRISLAPTKKNIKIPLPLYLEMIGDAYEVTKRGNSYKSSIERHLINKLVKKYRNKDVQGVTSTTQGEFNFLINRFNLPIKKKEGQFKKYLDSNDINAIQELTKSLIKYNIFEEDFLRMLDDYFIKDKLQSVVKLGKKLLAFRGKNLDTKLAKKLVKEISPDKPIKQLETLWQIYFEKNLLYLIFSYKKVFPKIGLMIEESIKYPDFVGVNHYNGVDIIEIKTHLTPALTFDSSHKNFSFSSDLSKAIIQCTNYMDAIRQDSFNDDNDREKIIKYTSETNLYRPRGIIIISSWPKLIRSSKIMKDNIQLLNRDFTKLRNSLDGIEILTFDEIIDIAGNYIENILSDS